MQGSILRLLRLGIDTYDEPVIYMRADCPVCRSEGFDAHSRVSVQANGRRIIATLHIVTSELLRENEAGCRSRRGNCSRRAMGMRSPSPIPNRSSR